MNIFKEFFNTRKKRKEEEEEQKFNKMTQKQKEVICINAKNLDEKALKNLIAKKPYLLSHIIADLEVDYIPELVDIATKKEIDIDNLVGKSTIIQNETIVNIAVKNRPELVLELDTRKDLQNLISADSLIVAFTKDPNVLYSSCEVLNSKLTLHGKDKEGKDITRTATLKSQLQRAMNLYFRPESMMNNGFDSFAKSIADKIDEKLFMEKVFGNKMTTRSTTAANEMLKQDPSKASVTPAKALHNWNNRVLHVVPNKAKRETKASADKYKMYKLYILGLLENPALNSFSEKEKTSLAKKCVSIVPELYYNLVTLQAFNAVAKKLTVQLSAYEAFKKQGKKDDMEYMLDFIGKENQKKVLARSKANATRRANKKAKAKEEAAKEEPAAL